MGMESDVLARVIVSALFVAVLAGTRDAWWHGDMGRDSLWELPHLFLYASTFCAISLGIYGWKKYREKTWKYLVYLIWIE